MCAVGFESKKEEIPKMISDVDDDGSDQPQEDDSGIVCSHGGSGHDWLRTGARLAVARG